MGGSTKQSQQATDLNRKLSARQFQTGSRALGGGLEYGLGELAFDQSDNRMEQDIAAKETDVLEGAASRPVGSTLLGATRDIENREAAKAIGTSSVAGQRVTDALDEINKLHSTLAGHGLRTTGLSSQAGALGIQALSLVPKNPKLSEALGVGAAGAAVYGGLTQPTTAPNKLSIAPLSATQFSGSDISTIAPNIYTDQQAAAATSGAASAFNMGPY